MSTPWDALAQHFKDEDAEAEVYPTITEQIDTPAIVIVPGDPWLEPGQYRIDTERYRAIAVAASADGNSAQATLHALIHFIRHHLPAGWDFETASGPQQTDHQGITYFVADASLTYNACDLAGGGS